MEPFQDGLRDIGLEIGKRRECRDKDSRLAHVASVSRGAVRLFAEPVGVRFMHRDIG